jgi:selenocysteine lyase/cysteine desulfurase
MHHNGRYLLLSHHSNPHKGSYGSLPYPVSQACAKFAALSEASPDKFFRYTYGDILPGVRERLAKFIGVDTDEVVMVPNATHGVNTVLRNFEWKAGDVIVKSEHPAMSLLETT